MAVMAIAMVIATATAMVAVNCGAAAWAMYQPRRKAGN